MRVSIPLAITVSLSNFEGANSLHNLRHRYLALEFRRPSKALSPPSSPFHSPILQGAKRLDILYYHYLALEF
jgi:hypothetical protein